ncbi:MAG TPA: hypothetical protein VGL93_23040 [Streptosporangiaceae bacterium]
MAVRFADYRGRHLIHGHNVEHEDMPMAEFRSECPVDRPPSVPACYILPAPESGAVHSSAGENGIVTYPRQYPEPDPTAPSPAAPPGPEQPVGEGRHPGAGGPPSPGGPGYPPGPHSPGPQPSGPQPSGPQPPGPRPSGPQRTVPLLLIGGGAGAALTLLVVALVTALIWPGWLISDPGPGKDSAVSTATALADAIQSRDAVTMHAVTCSDADPYVTDFAQQALHQHYLTNVEGTPTIDGKTAQVKLSLENDGQTTTYTVELAPRSARAWCVTDLHL